MTFSCSGRGTGMVARSGRYRQVYCVARVCRCRCQRCTVLTRCLLRTFLFKKAECRHKERSRISFPLHSVTNAALKGGRTMASSNDSSWIVLMGGVALFSDPVEMKLARNTSRMSQLYKECSVAIPAVAEEWEWSFRLAAVV